MSLESFKNLIECQSLERKIKVHLDKIATETNRIDFIEKNRTRRINEKEEKESELKSSQSKLSQSEKELFELESRLNKAKDNLSLASNEAQAKALENEINSLTPKTQELEEQGLELLEVIENLENEISDCESFITGSLETLEETKTEVSEHNQVEQKEIDNYQARIDSLLDDCPAKFKEAFLTINKKYRFKNPLTFIVGNKCKECKFQVSAALVPQIEQGQTLEYCSSCSRLLTPMSAAT